MASKQQEELESMRQLVSEAQAALAQQDETIKDLTSAPLGLGIIVQAKVERSATYTDKLKKGDKVAIRSDSPYFPQVPETGGNVGMVASDEILHAKDGDYYHIEYPNGYKNDYRAQDLDVIYEDGDVRSRPLMAVNVGGSVIAVVVPKWMEHPRIGTRVLVSQKTMQVTAAIEGAPNGDRVTILKQEKEWVAIEHGGSVKLIPANGDKYEGGEAILVDSSGTAILATLGKEKSEHEFVLDTHVKWEDIAGLDEVKTEMKWAVEGPVKHAAVYKRYGKKPPKGILLFGPPGCGKTMAGKALATEVANLYGKATGGFLYIKGPEMLSRWVGVAEGSIRGLFKAARDYKAENGHPAVVFIDEADAILYARGTGKSSDIERTIVPMFLTEMDGLQDSDCILVLATNRQDQLDPAVVRDGRVDFKLRVSRPTIEATQAIFKMHFSQMPMGDQMTVDSLAEYAAKELYDPKYKLLSGRTENSSVHNFTLKEIVSGAMAAGVAEKAANYAMRRELDKGNLGLNKEDVEQAIGTTYIQNLEINHDDAIQDWEEVLGKKIVGITKARV